MSRLLASCSSRKEFPGTPPILINSRLRAVSSGSSDSGLDSANSSVPVSPVPQADPAQARSFSFIDDLGPDYAVVLRIKLSPAIKKDCWLTLLTIENACETIGLHINVKKGLKLTLANAVETIAAAETTFKSMLFPDEWIHLAFNLGTISEGKRETKTLTAFVNCQKVWGVGLCVDKVQSKARKKEIKVTAGPLDPMSDLCHSSLIYSDIHLLKNCILSQENVFLNSICGPSDLNGCYRPDELCLTEMKNYLPDLLNTCTKIVTDPKVLKQHLDFANNVVAHFSPHSYWRKAYSVSEDLGPDCWTPTEGVCRAGGAEAILMMPLEAIDKGFPLEIIGEVLSNSLTVVTSNQRIYDEFKMIGGFSLVGSMLSATGFPPSLDILDVLLRSSSVVIGSDQFLFYPKLLEIGLEYVERFQGKETLLSVIIHVIKFIAELLNDTNSALDFNMSLMEKHSTFDAILACLHTFGENCKEPLPREDISNLLASLPASPAFLVKMMYLVLTLVPPYLLYLPYLTRSLLHVTMVKERSNPSLINKEIVENILQSDDDFDMEIYELEEDKVSDWEVVNQEKASRPGSSSGGSVIGPAAVKHSNLAASLLHKILAGFTILSDTESSGLADSDLSPESFLPLVGHSCPDVHSSSLDLIGLILERSKEARRAKFLEAGGFHQLAALIQDAVPSAQLISSALSLLHGHPVDVNVPFEFNKLSPPRLNLGAACLLPPLLVSSLSYLSLGHNLLCHVHELLANMPELTSALMSEHLLQALLAGLVKLGDLPEVESDIFGCNESELLVEDINNILRMLIVFFADKPGAEYEDLLDILFLATGLLQPTGQGEVKPQLSGLSEGAAATLRLGVCLILEEILLTVESGLTRLGDRPALPRYFQKEEFQDVDQEHPVNRPPKGKQASAVTLLSRLNQICKFSVNYLTSQSSKLLVEEENLVLSILNLCLDVARRNNSNNSLLKGLKDALSLGGIILLHLLNHASEKRKVELVKFLDSRDRVVDLLAEMLPSSDLREHLRVSLLATMKSSKETIFCNSEDSKRVTLFYGRVLTRSLFPDGPDPSFEPNFPVNHTSFPPWKAECFRCVSLFLAQVNQDTKKKAGVAGRFTEKVVEKHDVCRKFFLEKGRERVSRRHKSLRSWRRILVNQTHPLALWHDPSYEPKSLVLENITGLSRTYIRLKRAHVGLHRDKYFKPGFKYKCVPEAKRFAFLLGDRDSEENLNSKLDFPEQIQLVETVQEVTPTDLLDCDLVVSQDTLHVFASSSSSGAGSWSAEILEIESISKRRYQLKNIALEFFLTSGENHLIVFKSQDYRETFVKYLLDRGVCLYPKSDLLPSLTKSWRQGACSNFKYLTELNSLAGRTPNDLMQYPVFPWILADYTSSHLDLNDPASYRNLRRPIAIQEDANVDKYETTYRLLDTEGAGLPSHMGPYHYASHYSNTGIVLHLLEFIKFQDGNFDLADRSFHSLSTSWDMVSHVSTSDVKELIPQLFYLPEMFENNEGYALGKRQNGKEVDSVELPPWATDARIFVKIHRQALESNIVKQELSHWLDLVFGYKQRGGPAIEAVNVFHPATYAHNLDQAEDELEKRARQTMIATYGQTPLQLFTAPHPLADIELSGEKTSPTSVYRTVTGLRWGNYVGSPAYPTPYVVWQQAQPFHVRSLVRLDTNQVVGLPSNSLLVDNLGQDRESGQFLAAAQTSTANVVSWGHGDGALYCRLGKQGEEFPIAQLSTTDPVVIGAAHPKVSSLWLGHRSGRISVYKICREAGQSRLKLDYLTTVYGHMAEITSLTVSPEYGLAVSCCSRGYTLTWDLHSHTCLHHTLSSDQKGIAAAVAGGDTGGRVLAAVSESCGDIAVAVNSTLTLYTVNLNKVCQTTIRATITALTFSHLEEGKSVNSILIGTVGGVVRLYSSWDLTHMRDVTGCPPSPVTALCFSSDCLSLVVSTKNSFVTIFEKSGSHGLNRTPKYLSIQ